jgi:hypothetical protein
MVNSHLKDGHFARTLARECKKVNKTRRDIESIVVEVETHNVPYAGWNIAYPMAPDVKVTFKDGETIEFSYHKRQYNKKVQA